jgi:integrase
MRQAKTLKDAEIKRVLAYCATRQHALRDTTIFVFSLHAGLRAKELAALRISDVYDSVGNVHSSFVLSAAATKGARTRTVYVNKHSNANLPNITQRYPNSTQRHCFAVKKAVSLVQTQCANCSYTSSNSAASNTQLHTAEDARLLHDLQAKVLAFVCLQNLLGTAA